MSAVTAFGSTPAFPLMCQVLGGERHDHVRIERCDLNRMFVLDLQRRTYLAAPLRADLNAVERLALSVQPPSGRSANGPEIVVETTTVDTGERKRAFGYSARRVLTTRR